MLILNDKSIRSNKRPGGTPDISIDSGCDFMSPQSTATTASSISKVSDNDTSKLPVLKHADEVPSPTKTPELLPSSGQNPKFESNLEIASQLKSQPISALKAAKPNQEPEMFDSFSCLKLNASTLPFIPASQEPTYTNHPATREIENFCKGPNSSKQYNHSGIKNSSYDYEEKPLSHYSNSKLSWEPPDSVDKSPYESHFAVSQQISEIPPYNQGISKFSTGAQDIDHDFNPDESGCMDHKNPKSHYKPAGFCNKNHYQSQSSVPQQISQIPPFNHERGTTYAGPYARQQFIEHNYSQTYKPHEEFSGIHSPQFTSSQFEVPGLRERGYQQAQSFGPKQISQMSSFNRERETPYTGPYPRQQSIGHNMSPIYYQHEEFSGIHSPQTPSSQFQYSGFREQGYLQSQSYGSKQASHMSSYSRESEIAYGGSHPRQQPIGDYYNPDQIGLGKYSDIYIPSRHQPQYYVPEQSSQIHAYNHERCKMSKGAGSIQQPIDCVYSHDENSRMDIPNPKTPYEPPGLVNKGHYHSSASHQNWNSHGIHSQQSYNPGNMVEMSNKKYFDSSKHPHQVKAYEVYIDSHIEPSEMLDKFNSPSTTSDSTILSIDEIKQLPGFLKTKNGSKKAQQNIGSSTAEEISKFVYIIKPFIAELMCDTYANYMCQTLFQNCNSSQRLTLIEAMQYKLMEIATSERGTHSLQSLIALASIPREESIYLKHLAPEAVQLSKHVYGSHVIQRLLVSIKNKEVIIERLLGNVKFLAKNKLGLCVIKKCMYDSRVRNEVLEDLVVLMQDPYGNYAIQHLLEVWGPQSYAGLISNIRGNVAQLCIQKFSSNVMERFMREERLRQEMIGELLHEDKIQLLLNCPYGCYVIKTAAELADLKLKERLRNLIMKVRQLLYVKKLSPRWDEITELLN